MKKYTYILAGLLLVSGLAQAQKKNLKRVNKLFEMRAYKDAAEIYETKERNQTVLQNLADSYYYNTSLQKAVKTYRELFVEYGDSIDIDYHFRFAQALKGVKEYKEADKHLKMYYNKPINTLALIEQTDKTTPHNFKLKQIENKNSSSDFGLSFYGDNKVAFASGRNSENPNYTWNNLPYLDIYSATLTNQNVLEDIQPFSEAINTSSHESSPVFTKDGKTMYFNRTNTTRKKTDEERIAHIKIYKAELVNGEWTNVTSLPFTSNSYSTEHPALSKDEKTLYFASDMPGTYGSFDIYKVAINDDGTYGEPENLGDTINTKHREQFPFISEFNVLYFSSNGHLGFGGLDVFRSNLVNETFDKPVNLGSSINSNLDDFAYVIREKDNKGYVSSNKSGYDRVFGFSRVENPLTKYQVEGVVQDLNSKALLKGALVTLFDESDTVIQDTIVGDDAYYIFKIEPNKKYKVRGTQKAYIPQDVEFSTDSKGKVQHDIYLTLESFADAEERVKENEKGDVQVNLDKIFFDFDAAIIREDAAKTLQVLVDLMKKYPSMEVEVSAHTDARGPDEYNLNLSKKRAASTLEYLVSQGIERSRLKSIGYGEMQPLNACVKEGICDDREYDINRRCEFTILK
ncbi:OmpA family protein [Algibacter amylolyticus]|uniref:OmpA family protein n=1 Tax=Algibacter amylolyticus TaxID=1608400 RepID=A0A5M7BHC9_9FLAO|nr:OmpA family protein [Algibacter amylolyticus]KAA5827767.1 OmpA family protein [Algibacter amylolyticus]MBB5266993.1 outer membrane protein OmpA-like peptidoglycan-associated protein [Algibacter amylolyticus]TSJ82012.1 OmpA family protein [Algibacter amylolyticus]